MMLPRRMTVAPPLSVILVCKNPGPKLSVALESVWSQRAIALDVVVVDGASTDGTCDWLAAHRSRLGTLISEPDAGIYDAMNKGIQHARGEWVLFLGADDRLVGEMVLSEAINWTRRTEAGVVAGEAAYDDGRIYKLSSRVNPLARNFVHHQATLYRRSLFEENGYFDASLAVMGDYEFNLRIWKSRVRFKPIPLRLAACGIAGVSDAGRWRGYREEMVVRHRYFSLWRCWFWDTLSVLRFVRKKIVRSLARH